MGQARSRRWPLNAAVGHRVGVLVLHRAAASGKRDDGLGDVVVERIKFGRAAEYKLGKFCA